MFKDGKLFGKLNVIDLLVILIAVAVIAAVGLKLTGHTGRDETDKGVDVVYTVKTSGIEPEVAQSVQAFITAAQDKGLPGDQLMANGNLVDAYVTGVKAVPSQSNLELTWGDYGEVTASAGDRMDLIFTIEGRAEDDMTSKVGSQEVRVGRSHIVKTTHFEIVNGVTLTCQWADTTE